MSLEKRIHAARREKGLTQEQLAEAVGKSRVAVAQWETAQTRPRHPTLVKIAKALNVSIEWLESGVSPDGTSAPSLPPNVHGIPNLDIHAGMGNGGLGYIEVDEFTMRPLPDFTDGDWVFPPSVQTRIGKLRGKFAFPVEGDSMEPTLKAGSFVFVDTTRSTPVVPGLYVVDTGDGRLVKRVELIAGTDQISIMSDNPNYRNYEFHREEVHVFGRVIAVFSWNE